MTSEELKIQLDILQLEIQALQVENTRLHGEKPETTEQIIAGREEKSIVQKGLFLECSIRVFTI